MILKTNGAKMAIQILFYATNPSPFFLILQTLGFRDYRLLIFQAESVEISIISDISGVTYMKSKLGSRPWAC